MEYDIHLKVLYTYLYMLVPVLGESNYESAFDEDIAKRKREEEPPSVLLEKKPKKRRWVDRKSPPRKWSAEEDHQLCTAVNKFEGRNWKQIAEFVPNRNHTQCLQRWAKVLAPDLRKGQWTSEEDANLVACVTGMANEAEGLINNWAEVADMIKGRTTKQCRERWFNHLDPSIKRGNYTEEEDKLILEQQALIGNRWSVISGMLPGRTEDAVKIRWKTLTRPFSSTPSNPKKRAKSKSKTSMPRSPPRNTTTQKENKEPQLEKKSEFPEQTEVAEFVRKGCSKNLSDLFSKTSSDLPPPLLTDADSAEALLAGAAYADCLSKHSSLSELCLLDFDLPLQMDKTTPRVQQVNLLIERSAAPTFLQINDDESLGEGHYETDRLLLREILCC